MVDHSFVMVDGPLVMVDGPSVMVDGPSVMSDGSSMMPDLPSAIVGGPSKVVDEPSLAALHRFAMAAEPPVGRCPVAIGVDRHRRFRDKCCATAGTLPSTKEVTEAEVDRNLFGRR